MDGPIAANMNEGAASAGDAVAGRVRRLSALLEGLWQKGLAPRPDLSRLRREAETLSAGEAPWREALDRLLDSLAGEARLNAIGLTFAQVQLTAILSRRGRAARLWRDRPEIAAVPIAAPIVVLGQMRSGTTRIQRLLGCDPRLGATRLYEMLEPLPRRFEPRIAKSWAQLAMLNALNPAIRAVHPSGARAIDEPLPLLTFSLYGAQLDAQWWAPGFTRWWERQDRHGVYREFAQLLRTVLWRRGTAGGEAPLVLKVPQFMEDLDALLAVFPDARLICVNREREAVVASAASLAWHQMRLQSDAADRAAIGAEWHRRTLRREAIATRVRAANPQVPQIDIGFAAMNADWRHEMRRVYAFLDLDLPPSVEACMARYLRQAETSGYRDHRYRPEDFGLNAARQQSAAAG